MKCVQKFFDSSKTKQSIWLLGTASNEITYIIMPSEGLHPSPASLIHMFCKSPLKLTKRVL